MYIVTRQCQWPTGELVVEISTGGWDYINPDALVEKYPGEFVEFNDPREAVEAAIAIAKAWQKDEPGKNIGIAAGYTGGYTMPFEPQSIEELKRWADEEYAQLPKCGHCGKPVPEGKGYYIHGLNDVFCSESCASEVFYSDFIQQV